jgi:CRISPR-associated endoribonuclease Cas6
MPSKWSVVVNGSRLDQARPERLHAVVCRWLETSDPEHHATTKGFSISPAIEVDAGITFEVNLFDDHLRHRMERAASVLPTHGLALGNEPFSVSLLHGSQPTSTASWEQIASAARVVTGDSFAFEFQSPTVFRSHNTSIPFPLPGNIFGHLRRMWRSFAPEGEHIDIDLQKIGVTIEDFAIESHEVILRRSVSQGSRLMEQRMIGFTGNVLLRAPQSSARERQDLAKITLLANFTGVGTGTTYGLGETSAAPLQ